MLLESNTGFFQKEIQLPEELSHFIEKENYLELDRVLGDLLSEGGLLDNILQEFISIETREHLISIRQGPDDEDGIWHDDGSRDLAFSLSLTKNTSSLIGGDLLIRQKKDPENYHEIKTPKFGVLTIFLTGKKGFEHRTMRVKEGRRIVCAGWLTGKMK